MANSGRRVRTAERLLRKAIAERRATPSFDGLPVPNDVLSTIILAGIEAPSGYNLQPWRFVVVRSIEQKRRLREAAMCQSKYPGPNPMPYVLTPLNKEWVLNGWYNSSWLKAGGSIVLLALFLGLAEWDWYSYD